MKKASLLKNLEFGETKPSISVLFETEFTKEIRICFKEMQTMKEHKTKFPISVEMVEGCIDFGVNGEVLKLEKGDLISLDANVAHDLTALSTSIVRLTLFNQDSIKRVENLVN